MLNIFRKNKRKGGDDVVCENKIGSDMVFTHNQFQNCAARIVAGRLEQTASMMALGSTLATTIDGTHKGAGLTKMQGQISRVQYYFEQQKWITDTYFKQRGLDELGYTPNSVQASDDIELSGDIELDNTNSTTVIDFSGEHAEIDQRKDQKFEEVQHLLCTNHGLCDIIIM